MWFWSQYSKNISAISVRNNLHGPNQLPQKPACCGFCGMPTHSCLYPNHKPHQTRTIFFLKEARYLMNEQRNSEKYNLEITS